MPSACPCETLWIKNPAALLGTNLLVSDVCEANNINAFTRLVLLSMVVVGLLWPHFGAGGLVIVLFAIFFLYGRWLFAQVSVEQRSVFRQQAETENAEPFTDAGAPIRSGTQDVSAFPPAVSSPGVVVPLTKPTAANPFMNVLLDEIKYNPTRAPADSISDPNNKIILDDYFRVQWFSDPTDVFGRSQGQRQYYTMPSSSIPNDQGSFQNWLYLIPGKTCKEGGRDACYPGTNGGPVTWLNQPN